MCKIEGLKTVFALMACLGAAIHGKAQTCTASAVIEQLGLPWKSESQPNNRLKLHINVVANGATGMRRLVDVAVPADVRARSSFPDEIVAVVVPPGQSQAGVDYTVPLKPGANGRMKSPLRLKESPCRTVKSGAWESAPGSTSSAQGGSGASVLLGNWLVFGGGYASGIIVNGRFVAMRGKAPRLLRVGANRDGKLEALLAHGDDRYYDGQRLRDASCYSVERLACAVADGVVSCGGYILRAAEKPDEVVLRSKGGREWLGLRGDLDDAALVRRLEQRTALAWGQYTWRGPLAVYTGTGEGTLAVAFPHESPDGAVAELWIGGRQIHTAGGLLVGPKPLHEVGTEIRIFVNDPVLGRGVLEGTYGNVYALTFTTQPGNRQQHWFAASASDESPNNKGFRDEALQQAAAAYRADNGLLEPVVVADRVEADPVEADPVEAAPPPEHKSGWDSMAEIAQAVSAGLGQAQLAESARLRGAAERQAEISRQQAAERQAEYARQRANAQQQAEYARQQAAQQQAEYARQRAAQQQAEYTRQQAAAQQQAEIARQQPAPSVSQSEKDAPFSCLVLGQDASIGILENRCAFPIDVTYCNQKGSDGFRCAANQYGSFTIAANGRQTTAYSASNGRLYYVVCRSPYSASGVDRRWDGTKIIAACE